MTSREITFLNAVTSAHVYPACNLLRFSGRLARLSSVEHTGDLRAHVHENIHSGPHPTAICRHYFHHCCYYYTRLTLLNQALLIKSQLLSSTSGRKGGELWSRAEHQLLRAQVH